jgi:hypothetical protein
MDENTTPDGLDQPDLWLVDRLIDNTNNADTGPEVHSVDRERVRMARIVNALRQPATGAELSAEESYLSAFDEVLTTERKPVRTIVIGARAAVVAGIAVLAAATGAAAFTGSLPGPLQRAAHSVVGAPDDDQGSNEATDEPTGTPSESPSETPTGSPTSARGVGPDATGPAAFGLCTAWSKGGLSTTSVAYRNLATTAGGPDGIAAYCATIVKPGSGSTNGTGSPTAHPHGSPTSHPGQTSHPTGSPTAHPGGH